MPGRLHWRWSPLLRYGHVWGLCCVWEAGAGSVSKRHIWWFELALHQGLKLSNELFWFFLKNLVGAWVLTAAPPDSWHLSFLPFSFFPSRLKRGNLSNWSICKACICRWIPPLSVCTIFSSYSRRERKSEREEGNGGEAVELYWKSLPWI